MKKTIAAVLGLMAGMAFMSTVVFAGASCCNTVKTDECLVQQGDSSSYTCPMHPGIKSDKPGKCPECSMNLETAAKPVLTKDQAASAKTPTVAKKKAAVKKISYSCPMHPDVKSDKAGKCAKCGMFLEQVK